MRSPRAEAAAIPDSPSVPNRAVRIDFAEPVSILDLPVTAADPGTCSWHGGSLYLKTADDKTSLQLYDLNTRKNRPSWRAPLLVSAMQNMLYRPEPTWSTSATKGEATRGRIAAAASSQVDPLGVDPIFNEASHQPRLFLRANMAGWTGRGARQVLGAAPARRDAPDLPAPQWCRASCRSAHHTLGAAQRRAKTVPGGLPRRGIRPRELATVQDSYGGLNFNPARSASHRAWREVNGREYLALSGSARSCGRRRGRNGRR